MGTVIPGLDWYGARPSWRLPLEATAKRRHGRHLDVQLGMDVLTYRHDGLNVSGRIDPVPVTIRFHRRPLYEHGDLAPEDYPRVIADPGQSSKHRMPSDDALCLWAIDDPAERRWSSRLGLLALLDLTADHLFFEDVWRRDGVWHAPEAPHGRLR